MNLLNKIKLAFATVNPVNSSMSVHCIESEKCCHRHSEMCSLCGKNIGESALHSYFKDAKPMGFWKKLRISFSNVNPVNSSMSVQCIESCKCCVRHTETCKYCDNNIGPEACRSYYVDR